MESMRAVGYSLSTALADVIDNSITAKAASIDIFFSAESDPYVAVLDDGTGMDGQLARRAMQLAGTPPGVRRAPTDLGRFGLGLKTASLSQCRRLTIITKQAGILTALVWDLDHILSTGKWNLIVLDDDEVDQVPQAARIRSKKSGTLVVWQVLDKALEGSSQPARVLDERMAESRDHLSLVFHRFLNGDGPAGKITLALNQQPIEGADPFLAKSSRTQVSRQETIEVDGEVIQVRAYTLPFLNKMTAVEKKKAFIAGNLRDSQGFYVYRAGRLVIWGTWFRLVSKNDLGKLTRVKVDIPNSLDHLWSLDIKKSSAVPPAPVRDRLRLLAGSMLEPGELVHRFRGRKIQDDSLIRPWELELDRDTFRYQLNRAHPLLSNITNELEAKALSELDNYLRIVETTFPVQDLFNRMTGDQVVEQEQQDPELLRRILLSLWIQKATVGGTLDEFVEQMLGIEPFDQLAEERSNLATWLEKNAETGTD